MSAISSAACLPACSVASLLMGVPSSLAAWQEVYEETLEPLLRRAFMHAHSCKCDVAPVKA